MATGWAEVEVDVLPTSANKKTRRFFIYGVLLFVYLKAAYVTDYQL